MSFCVFVYVFVCVQLKRQRAQEELGRLTEAEERETGLVSLATYKVRAVAPLRVVA